MAEEVKEKKVTIKIPIDPLNPNDIDVPVGVNGDFTVIKRGEKVEVSQNIVDILENAGYL